MSSNAPKRMRAAKAAEYLEVSRSTLAKWRTRGIGPAPHYCGPRIVYYCQHEIDAWLEECDRRQKKAQTPIKQTTRS
jgi:predicted DNA-binding transcriptional regulator AlpA